MSHTRPAILLLLLLLLPTACTIPGQEAQPPAELKLTGFIEAETVDIAPEIGGRLVAVTVDEGDQVAEDQVLARLDDSLQQRQIALAEADIAIAEAELARLRAGVRPTQIALAEAQAAQAETALAAAESALADAILLRDNPQFLDVEIAQAQAAQTEAEARARAARRAAEAADVNVQMWEAITRDLWDGVDVTLPTGGSAHFNAPPDKVQYANQQWNLAGQSAWAAWQDAAAAEAVIDETAATLADLRRRKADPQDAEAAVIAAENARNEAAVAVEQARTALAALKTGPTAAQLAAAEAAVEQARRARDVLTVQLDRNAILAPAAGLISARFYHPDEVIGPNQRLFTLHTADSLQITIFAPARLLDTLHPGDELPFAVDTAPGRRFTAEITTISDEPEYTLRQAQNVAERAATVYAVHLSTTSPDPRLRPGLPADVFLTDTPD